MLPGMPRGGDWREASGVRIDRLGNSQLFNSRVAHPPDPVGDLIDLEPRNQPVQSCSMIGMAVRKEDRDRFGRRNRLSKPVDMADRIRPWVNQSDPLRSNEVRARTVQGKRAGIIR